MLVRFTILSTIPSTIFEVEVLIGQGSSSLVFYPIEIPTPKTVSGIVKRATVVVLASC